MSENKKIKVVFDPAFFEAFNGTQEELDHVMAEIRAEFENKSVEEIRAMSHLSNLDDLDEEEIERIERSLVLNIKPTLQ